jgi:hypothetical protein
MIAFFLFIGLILAIFYNYFTVPTNHPFVLLVAVFWITTHALIGGDFGEYIGFMKKKNFNDEGGLQAVYHRHITLPGGMKEYFFTTQKRYAEFVGYEDFQEKNMVERFLSFFTNSRMCSIIDKAEMFEDVPEDMKSVPEGAILYRGTFRKGVKVLNRYAAMQVKLEMYASIISEMFTVTEKAKAISEQSSIEQSTDLVQSVIKVGTAIQNLPGGMRQPPPPQGGP